MATARAGNDTNHSAPAQGTHNADDLAQLAAVVQRRQLTTPLLLFLVSHRPLTFVAGQLLYALAPIGALLGWERTSDWAALLSAPDANQQLLTLLDASYE